MVSKQTFRYLDIAVAIFVMTLLVSNIASVKLVGVGPFVFDAGTLLFPLAYIIGGVITEVYGFRQMRRTLLIGIGTLLVTVLTFWIVGHLPAASDWTNQPAYEATLGVVWRIVLASITAILVGELLNSYVLARLKIKFAGKHIWARIVSSSALGNLVDTVVFSTIAFAGAISGSAFISLIATVYFIKLAVEVVISPLTLLVIRRLKKAEQSDSFEQPNLIR